MSKRPFLISAYNTVRSRSDIDAEKLIKQAIKKSGLVDFGDESFREGFTKLINSINSEAHLHSFGIFITQQRIVNILCNRLRIEALIKKYPEILSIVIEKPIIITGLQRTGTTRLHRLLSSHSSLRSLVSWEALNPAPMEGDKNNKKRIAFAKTAERALKYMAPDFFAIHPVEYLAPEEDILLNDMSFVSTVPEATMHLPSYAAWVQAQKHLMPYSYLKKVLQVLTWQVPKQRWVLKTPQYLEFLDEASTVFPDAKFIHTYRDPLKVLPSFFSMVYHSRKIFSDQVDRQEVAQHWLKKNSYMMNKAMHFWENTAEINCLHVSYYDMLEAPLDQMKILCDFAELPMNESIQAVMNDVDQRNKQNRFGVHHYTLEEFGISGDDINSHFDLYRKKFSIPYE